MREVRLGDVIDDYCVRCKRVMNHSVVSVLNAEPAKVRCRTCHSDHDFRHELPPPPKIDPRKAGAFNEVLAKVAPPPAAPAPVESAPVEPAPVESAPVEPAPEEPAAEEPAAEVPMAEVPVAKARKARARK